MVREWESGIRFHRPAGGTPTPQAECIDELPLEAKKLRAFSRREVSRLLRAPTPWAGNLAIVRRLVVRPSRLHIQTLAPALPISISDELTHD